MKYLGREGTERRLPQPGADRQAATNGKPTRSVAVFGEQGDSFVVLDERLENAKEPPDKIKPFFYFGYENGRPMLNVQDGRSRELRRETLDMTQSILAQHKDPEKYPELGRLTDAFVPEDPGRVSDQ